MKNRGLSVRRLVIAGFVLLACATSGPAQVESGSEESPATELMAPPAESEESDSSGKPSSEADSQANEVEIRVEQFGVGGSARMGEWTGIRVGIQDSSIQPRNVVVRIVIPDPEGDKTYYERVPVTKPGGWTGVWIYCRLRGTQDSRDDIVISVHEAKESSSGSGVGGDEGGGGDGEEGVGLRFKAGRRLGHYKYQPPNLLPSHTVLFGIVGDRAAGLEQYSQFRGANAGLESAPPLGHENIVMVRGLTTRDLPDRWMGYTVFETLVWTSADRERPTSLTEPQAEAIREWVHRGGHLVVVLPAVGQTWIVPAGSSVQVNPLADLMPTVRVQRAEGVDLGDYRELLTRDRRVRLPSSGVVQQMMPTAQSDAYSAMPILSGPTGEPVVVRRLVGTGAVTVIGLDVTAPVFRDTEKALQADFFWARILGKRTQIDSATDLARNQKNGNYPDRSISGTDLDGGIHGAIRLAAQTATGLLLAFIVFLLYWLLAGPVGFYILKGRNLKHHAWVGFACVTALFTFIAWGGASALKGQRVEVRHVTILDHVYGQTNQRARAWLNIYNPLYGDIRYSAPATPDWSGVLGRNMLVSFDQPNVNEAGSSFPDARGYSVNGKQPSAAVFPSRATSRMMQVDWAGSVGEKWGMPQPRVDEGGGSVMGSEIRLVSRPDAPIGERDWELEGKLTHNLPGTLKNVSVILNLGLLPRPRPGAMFSEGYVKEVKEWEAGVELNLSRVYSKALGSATQKTGLYSERVDRWLGSRPVLTTSVVDIVHSHRSLETLVDMSVVSLLPEKADSRRTEIGAAPWLQRSVTHMYDVSRWFTQPSLIVMGELENVTCPVPVLVDGEKLPQSRERNSGTVLVRWMYPLPARPPGLERVVPEPELLEDEERGAEGGSGGG